MRIIDIFHGENPNTTKEQIETQINKIIKQIESGDYEFVDLDDEE